MVGRAELRGEIEATRAAFFALLERVPRGVWGQPSRNPGWTVARCCSTSRTASARRRGTQAAVEGRDARADWGQVDDMNHASVRERARGATAASLRDLYEAGHARTLTALESVPDGAWGRTAVLYGGVPWTVEDCFRYVVRHFREHAADVEPAAAL